MLENLRLALLIIHLVGTSAIVGAFILQMPWRKDFDFSPLLIGSIVQVLSGNALIAVRMISGAGVIEAKMIVKLALALVILGLIIAAMVRQRRLRSAGSDDRALRPLLHIAGWLGVVEIAVAVLWH
ncbi:hypothetical protein [Microbacterium sp. JZ37]|uniref:hypothetical protein n=1 Tax=Microbacterium sp. JZ37 TaxID=2654193 RepID=UPI002B45A7BE|nr:hypothetical protein [Microbacterium sp. JZ37]WRH16169.1 hypothetical protein GC092_00630 [Microbacterium sp. JZ37]